MDGDLFAQALAHRRTLDRVCCIAVTGSCGKTTTKDVIASLLSTCHTVRKSEGTLNCGADLARSVLAVRPDDAYLVQELGAWGPATLDAGIELVQPRMAVVTNLRNDHYSSLHGPRGAQAEKGKLVAALPADGVAVLNWDDPLARELAGWTVARVISYGRHAEAELRAWDVRARWPETLSFWVEYAGHRRHIRSRLFGEHLLGSALAALAVGLACGLSLEAAATALQATPPTFRRMTPATHAGVTFIRDDYKAPADSFPEVLAFMREARADRKLAVIGRISDFAGRSRATYTHIARDARQAVDVVVFVGQRAAELWGSDSSHRLPDNTFVFATVREAAAFLRDELKGGDLVLLKGSGPADHLERLLLDRQAPIACWEPACGRTHACDACTLLRPRPLAAAYDEAFDASGSRRLAYASVAEHSAFDPLDPSSALAEQLRSRPLGDDARLLPIPWILEDAECRSRLQPGVAQRARALQMFFADVVLGDGRFFGAQSGLRRALVADILHSEGHSWDGLRRCWAGHATEEIRFVYGPDLVRSADGRWSVLEDNVGCVGGSADSFFVFEAYASAAWPGHVESDPRTSDLGRALRRWLDRIASPGSNDQTEVVARLGCESDICGTWSPRIRENERRLRILEALGIEASPAQAADVDVASPRLRGLVNFADDHLAQHVFDCRLPLLNAPGTGILGNKAWLPFVEDMIRFYCQEEPLLSTPETRLLVDGALPNDPSAWVVKGAAGCQGTQVWVLGDLGPADVDAVRASISHTWSRTPMVAQRHVEPSRLAPGPSRGWDAYRLELRLVAYVLGWQAVSTSEQPLGKAVSQLDRRRLNNISQGALYVPVVRARASA